MKSIITLILSFLLTNGVISAQDTTSSTPIIGFYASVNGPQINKRTKYGVLIAHRTSETASASYSIGSQIYFSKDVSAFVEYKQQGNTEEYAYSDETITSVFTGFDYDEKIYEFWSSSRSSSVYAGFHLSKVSKNSPKIKNAIEIGGGMRTYERSIRKVNHITVIPDQMETTFSETEKQFTMHLMYCFEYTIIPAFTTYIKAGASNTPFQTGVKFNINL